MTVRRPRALGFRGVAIGFLATLLLAAGTTPLFTTVAFAASPYEGSVLSDNPIAYYRLNEAGGSVVDDLVAANDGSYHGAPAFSRPGATLDGDTAVTFDASTGSYGRIPRTIQDDFTIELWVRSTSVRDNCGFAWYCGAPLVDAEVCGGAGDFGVSLVGGKAAFGIGPHDLTIFSQSLLNDDAFHHVVATRQAATGRLLLYVDGALEASGETPSRGSLDAPYIGLGTNPCLQDHGAGGDPGTTLDDVALYTTVLPDDRIADHFRRGAATDNGTGPAEPLRTLTVVKAGSGDGTVTSSPGGIDCGADCSHGYEDASRVTLTATPAAGSTFVSWGGGCERRTGNECVVPMNVSQTIAASFSAAATLSVEKNGGGSGDVTSDHAGIECGTDCREGFAEGTTVILEAAPSAGSTFVSWSGCDEVVGDECSVTVSADRTVTAAFGTAAVSHERDVTLDLQGHLRATGRVTVRDGFEGCADGVLVKVQRRRPGLQAWVTVARLVTDADGTFGGPVKDLARSYRARVPASTIDASHSCRNALSHESAHAHRGAGGS